MILAQMEFTHRTAFQFRNVKNGWLIALLAFHTLPRIPESANSNARDLYSDELLSNDSEFGSEVRPEFPVRCCSDVSRRLGGHSQRGRRLALAPQQACIVALGTARYALWERVPAGAAMRQRGTGAALRQEPAFSCPTFPTQTISLRWPRPSAWCLSIDDYSPTDSHPFRRSQESIPVSAAASLRA